MALGSLLDAGADSLRCSPSSNASRSGVEPVPRRRVARRHRLHPGRRLGSRRRDRYEPTPTSSAWWQKPGFPTAWPSGPWRFSPPWPPWRAASTAGHPIRCTSTRLAATTPSSTSWDSGRARGTGGRRDRGLPRRHRLRDGAQCPRAPPQSVPRRGPPPRGRSYLWTRHDGRTDHTDWRGTPGTLARSFRADASDWRWRAAGSCGEPRTRRSPELHPGCRGLVVCRDRHRRRSTRQRARGNLDDVTGEQLAQRGGSSPRRRGPRRVGHSGGDEEGSTGPRSARAR